MLTTKHGHPDADPVIVNCQADLEAGDSFLPCDPKLGKVVILDGIRSF